MSLLKRMTRWSDRTDLTALIVPLLSFFLSSSAQCGCALVPFAALGSTLYHYWIGEMGVGLNNLYVRVRERSINSQRY